MSFKCIVDYKNAKSHALRIFLIKILNSSGGQQKVTVREDIVTLHKLKSIHDLVSWNNEILIFIHNFHTLSLSL